MSWLLKFLHYAAFILIGLPLPHTSPQQMTQSVFVQTERADRYYMTGDFAQAEQALRQALIVAGSSESQHLRSDVYFRLGYVNQTWSNQFDGERQETKLREAIAAYESIPPDDENYGPARNNLGNLYMKMASREAKQEAIEYFRQAASIDHPMRASFLFNLGQALHAMGRLQEAEEVYWKILEFDPQNEQVQEALVELYVTTPQTEPQKSLRLLDELLQGGNALAVISSVKRMLQERDDLSGQDRERLLLLLMRSYYSLGLTALSYDSEKQFLERLEPLEEPLRTGVDELKKAFEWADKLVDTAQAIGELDWWMQTPERRFVFSRVLKTFGDRYDFKRNHPAAQLYYRIAMTIDSTNIDPYVRLASSLIDTEGPDRYPAVLGSLTLQLYDPGSDTYTSADWASIERFHTLSGTFLAYQGRWGNSTDPSSAMFHLEHAVEAADKVDADSTIKGQEVLPQSAETLYLLGQAYQTTGKEKHAWPRYLQAAEWALAVKDWEVAASAMERAREVSGAALPKESRRAASLAAALALHEHGEFRNALDWANWSLELNPNEASMLLLVADALSEHGEELERARALTMRLLELMKAEAKDVRPPNISDEQWASLRELWEGHAHSILGQVLLHEETADSPDAMTKTREAIREFQMAGPLLKENKLLYARNQFRLGFAYAKIGELVAARDVLSEVIALDTAYTQAAQPLLGRVLQELGRRPQ